MRHLVIATQELGAMLSFGLFGLFGFSPPRLSAKEPRCIRQSRYDNIQSCDEFPDKDESSDKVKINLIMFRGDEFHDKDKSSDYVQKGISIACSHCSFIYSLSSSVNVLHD